MSRTNGRRSPGLRLDIAIATGFVVETGVYCVYTCLFIAALPVLIKARRRKDRYRGKVNSVLLAFSSIMYMVATLHLVLAAIRFYKSIFLHIDLKGPISYFHSFKHWEYLGLIALLCIQTWLGDVLVIYRCYVVWNNNLWLISLPLCLLLGQIGVNAVAFYWLCHPSSLSRMQAQRIRNAIYPLAFAQNFITTSLIILKISLQHRASKKAGIVDTGSELGLMRVVRIVIESAAIYTVQMFLLVILAFRRDNFQYVVQAAVTPSIGINFVLLAIRIEASRNVPTVRSDKGARSTLLPQWAHRNNSEISSEDCRSCASLPSRDENEVPDHIIDTKRPSGAGSSCNLESPSNTRTTETSLGFSLN